MVQDIDSKRQTSMFWTEEINAGFASYAIKKRTQTAIDRPEVDAPNDLIILEASNIHSA